MPVGFDVSRDMNVNYPGAVRRAQRKRLEDAMAKGFAVSQENAPQDRGTLQQTAVPPEWVGDTIQYRYTQPYAKAQEFGTGPYWPPAEPLVDWAERVGKDPGFGYYIQQKIAREGIEPKRFARAGRDATRRFLQRHGLDEYLDRELR